MRSKPRDFMSTPSRSCMIATYLWVVQVCVEHDDREGENVHSVSRVENLVGRRWLLLVVSDCKSLSDPVDFLTLPWEPKSREKRAQALIDGQSAEIVEIRKRCVRDAQISKSV